MMSNLGWQPIETAPKDGTPILVWDGRVTTAVQWWPAHGTANARWDLCAYGYGDPDKVTFIQPTHWMPLPLPPSPPDKPE